MWSMLVPKPGKDKAGCHGDARGFPGPPGPSLVQSSRNPPPSMTLTPQVPKTLTPV